MSFISDSTLKSLRQIHASAMMDEAELYQRYEGGPDEYNMPEPDQYIYLETLACSFRPSTGSNVTSSKEAMGDSEVPLLDGQIAFNVEVDVAMTNFDRVKITRLHGERLRQPLLFDLAGPALRDYVSITFPLKKVTEVDSG